MNRNRLIMSVGLVLTLIVLMAWQQQRSSLIAACHDKGGVWNGAICRPEPGRILLQRDLRRS